MVSGWVTGAAPDVQGKDGDMHHGHSALNPSFVAESRVSTGRKSERRLPCVISKFFEIFSSSVIGIFFEGPQGQTLRTIVCEMMF
jgi:hypothetical protein